MGKAISGCMLKKEGDYYCIRCSWHGDAPDEPRENDRWHCCPVCRGHALPRCKEK